MLLSRAMKRLVCVCLAAALLSPQAFAAQLADAQAPEIAQQLSAAPALPGIGLFSKAPPRAAETPASVTPGAVRERTATLNPAYLQSLLGAAPLAIDNGTATAARAVLNLFDDLEVSVIKLETRESTLGPQVIRAAVAGGGSATLVVENGMVTADITTGDHNISITPKDGAYRIVEYTGAVAPDAAVRPAIDPQDLIPRAPGNPNIEKPSAANPAQIKLLMVYTPQALALLPNIRSSITLLMDYLNTALVNSQIPAQFTLVGIEQVNYNEPAGMTSDTILNDAEAGAADFARIRNVRYAAGADLVSVLSAFNESSGGSSKVCGLASLNDFLDTVSSLSRYTRDGYSTVSAFGICLAAMPSAFAHEVGHNLGASHDRYTDTSLAPGPGFYAAGYVDVTGKFRDIMSYANKCSDASVTCPVVPYYSNPNLSYNGRALGVADSDPQAADASRRIGEIAPYIAQFHGLLAAPATPTLALLVSGSGTITSNPSGISCGNSCSASFTAGQQVTLTASAPAGWGFKQWSGACSGSGTCTVAMNASASVTATFVPTLRLGPVFSSAQATSQSFIRVVNAGSTAGTVTVRLSDFTSGNQLGEWTSPSIPAGTAPQYGIAQIESAVGVANKPQYYSVSVASGITGFAQHVLWKPSDGTLTNLSTCEVGVSASTTQVANVHSSVLDNGYPSSVAVTNNGVDDLTSVTLGIYDARNATKLGTYTTGGIAAGAKAILTVDALEAGAHITPASDMFHYVIKAESSGFTGFLQHLVNNQRVGVTTDMTTTCAFGGAPAMSPTVAILQPGPIYSSAQSASQSFLRFANTGTTAGTVAVTLRNYSSGAKIGQWISPTIPAGAAPQYAIADIEASIRPTSKPQYYSAQVEAQMTGTFAHVLWKPADGTLTNLSTCDMGIAAPTGQVANVHSSIIGPSYPSVVAITNTGTTAVAPILGVYDASTGAKLGTSFPAPIPAGGQLLMSVSTIEANANIQPKSTQFHYVIKLEGSDFTGFLQHLVNNQNVGVITDMTTICRLPAQSVTYTDCTPDVTSCPATVGTPVTGQVKQSGYASDYRFALTAGRTYTISVKGASSGSGTLTRPYVYLFPASGGSPVAQGGSTSSTSNDVSFTYTPTTSGNFTVQVTTYVYADAAGSFVLTVQ